MWVLNESYDPATQVLYLDLVSEAVAAPIHPGLPEPKVLGTFKEAAEARQFTDVYMKSLAYEKDKVVSEVRCGEHSNDSCKPGKPCHLGLDGFHCKTREGQ